MSHLEYRTIGPPGCGKSTWLARQVEHAVEKHGVTRVAVASFTRAAAGVIAGRVNLPDDQVGTLHAHCWRALGRPPIAETQAKQWNEHVGSDPRLTITSKRNDRMDDPLGAADDEVQDHGGDDLLRRAALHRARCIPMEEWPDDVSYFGLVWNKWKEEAGALDFTDLIERGAELATAPHDPAVLMVDEAQDMSPLEWRLVRRWGAATSAGLLVCADPAQCIYSFKGATPDEFFNPEIDPANWRVLSQSYRVPVAVHNAAVSWLGQSSVDVLAEYHPRGEMGSVTTNTVGDALTSWRKPEDLVQPVIDHARADRTVMILASCSYMLQPLCAALRERGVPFHNPYRPSNGAWNPMRGGVDRLRAYIEPVRPDLLDPNVQNAHPRLWDWIELQRWVDDLKAAGTVRRGAKVMIEQRVKEQSSRAFNERRSIEPGELASVFETEALLELKAAMTSGRPWSFFAGRLLATREKSYAYALTMLDTAGPAAITCTPKVVVGTVHSVKGEEADAVYLFPDLSPQGFEQWCETGEPKDSVVRTFYVGMTRARQELHLLNEAGSAAVSWL